MTDEILQCNREAIAGRYPELAQRLATHRTEQTRRVRLVPTEENAPSLVAVTANGEEVPLHDLHRPRAETSSWLAGLPKDCFRGANILILGVGLAYHLQRFASQADRETFITAVEPDWDLFCTVLRHVDLSHLLGSPRITWLVGLPAEDAIRRICQGGMRHRFAGQGIQILSLPGFRTYYSGYLKALAREIQSELIEVGIRSRTARLQAHRITQNILNNLQVILKAPGVLSLWSHGAGRPGFVVAPGPSLTRQLTVLRKAVNKGYVVAVDTAARILRRESIPYHFVVAVDYTELNRLHFDNAAHDPAQLVAYVGVDPEIPASYPAKTIFFDHLAETGEDSRASPLPRQLGLSDHLGSLVSYGSTTDCAYHFARCLGCCPIVFVGVDLAFPGGRFYAAGAMQDEMPLESPHTERQYLVPDNRGGRVATSHIYRLFCRQLGDLIHSTGGLVMNASLEGAFIPGTCPVDLAEFAESLPDAPPAMPAIRTTRIAPALVANRLRAMLSEMSEDRRMLQAWDKEIRRIDTRHSVKFRSRLLPVLKQIAGTLKSRDSLHLAASLAEGSASEILGQAKGVGILGGTDQHENEIARDRLRNWIREIREGIEFLRPLLDEAARRCSA